MVSRAVTFSGVLLVAALCGCASGTSQAQVAAPPATTGPVCRPSGSGFALSLTSNRGGETTPEKAAEAFARRGAVSKVPLTGWRVTTRGDQSVTLQTGTFQLRTIQGSDGTWQVDSGDCL